MACDSSFDHSHMPLYHPRNKWNEKKRKRKIKSKKIDKRKIKLKINYKGSSISWQDEPNNTLPIITILSLAQVVT